MTRKEFIKLILKLVKFIIVLAVIDLTLGNAAKKAFFSQTTGKFARLTHTIYENHSEILIMGSSHANRHYIPDIFSEKLKKTTYNAGIQGQGLIFQVALQKMLFKRYKPTMIILNIDKNWLYKSDESYDRLSDLYPYYQDFKTELYPLLSVKTNWINYKLAVKSYQMNSTLAHIIKYYFYPQNDISGYTPLYGEMKNIPKGTGKKNNQPQKTLSDIDSISMYSFKEFIHSSIHNKVQLVIVISPSIMKDDNAKNNISLSLMKSMAHEQKITLIDYSDHPFFTGKYQLFNDPGHLNNEGAKIFSNVLADSIQKLYHF